MDKETKLGLTVPWIGLICFSINIITTIIYLFNSSFGFVIPISIFFGFLTILSWAYIIFTAFPLIWKLMTPSEIYQKVYKFNVFIFLFSMLIFPFLVLSVIFSLIGLLNIHNQTNNSIYISSIISILWYIFWMYQNNRFNKKYQQNTVSQDAFLGYPGISKMFQVFSVTSIILLVYAFLYFDFLYWIDITVFIFLLNGLIYYEVGRNYKNPIDQKQKNIAFFQIILAFVFSFYNLIILASGYYFNRYVSPYYLLIAFIPIFNFFFGRFSDDRSPKSRLVDSLTFSLLFIIPCNLTQDLPPFDDGYFLPLVAIGLLTYRILIQFPFGKDSSKINSIIFVILALFTFVLIYFDLFVRANFIAINFGRMTYLLGLIILCIFIQSLQNRFFLLKLQNPNRPFYRYASVISIVFLTIGMIFFSISYRTFSYDNASANLQLGASVSSGISEIRDSFLESRKVPLSDYETHFKFTTLSYSRGYGENQFDREPYALFLGHPFNDKSLCNGNGISPDTIQSITFQVPNSIIPYKIQLAGITISSNLTANDLIDLSKAKASPIYTQHVDSNPMDGVSIIQATDNRYLEFSIVNNKIKRFTYFNDTCNFIKKNYSVNAIFTPEIYEKVDKLDENEFVLKRNARSFADLKGSRIKETFLGGEVIQSNFKISEAGKSYYFYKGWIPEENIIPLKDLLILIRKQENGNLNLNSRNYLDFIMPASISFYEKNLNYFTKQLSLLEKSKNQCEVNKSFSNTSINYRYIVKFFENENEFIEFDSNFNPQLGIMENYLFESIFGYPKKPYSSSIFNINQSNIASLNSDFGNDLNIWSKIAVTAKEPYLRSQIYAKFIIDFSLHTECVYAGGGGDEGGEKQVLFDFAKTPKTEILAIEYEKTIFDSEEIDNKIYFLPKKDAEYNATFLKDEAYSIYCQSYGGKSVSNEERELYFNNLTKKQHSNFYDKPLCVK